jgi:transposase
MNKITTVGLDLAKNVFHLVVLNERGQEESKKRLSRGQVLRYFATVARCRVAMESCAGGHYFGREFKKMGHEVKLIPAQYVKAYVRGQKNDYNDARAIAEAARVAQMRVVAVKTVEQQELQALARLREGSVRMRTGLANRLRGLLGEQGIVVRKGLGALRRALPELLADESNGLSERFRRWLALGREELAQLDERITTWTAELKRSAGQDEAVRRLLTVPAFGPIVASVYAATVGDGSQYRRGREAAAAVGLVPRQHSTGGKAVLLGISKGGDRYLRCLLVHGARAVVRAAAHKDDPLSRWVNRIRARRGTHKATVALANKLTRIAWAVLRNGGVYQPALAVK